MSAFSKLKYYARKPVAVIMAASLVTSTVPAVSLIAAAPVYAQQKAESKSNYATKDATWSDLSQPLTLTFDTHPSEGENGSATAKVSKADILKLLQGKLAGSFTYTKGGTDAYSTEVDKALNGLANELETKLNEQVDEKTKVTVSDVTMSEGSLEYQIIDAEISDVTSSDGDAVAVESDEDGWTITSNAAAEGVTISFDVTSVTYQLRFDYTYTKTTTTEVAPEEKPTQPEPGEGETEPGGEAGTEEGSGDGSDTEQGGSEEPETPQYEETVEANQKGYYPGPDESAWSDKLEMKFDAPQSIETGAITTSDAWAGVAGSINAAKPSVSGLRYSFFDPQTGSATLVSAPEGLEYTIEKDGANDRFFSSKISYADGAYVITVSPKRAFKRQDENKTITVEFSYPDGQPAGTIKVTVSPIAPEKINLSEVKTEALDFRMAKDQLDDILTAANKAVADQTGGELTDYYESVEFTESGLEKYYAADGQSLTADDLAFTVRASKGTEETEDPIDNFEITGQPTVQMKSMQTIAWGEDGSGNLSLTAETLGGEKTLTAPDSGTWFRTEASTAWKDGELVQTTAETPSDGLEFSEKSTLAASGQGAQEGTFFVQDSGTQVVKKITGVTYQYDNIAPGLTALNAKAGSREFKSSDGEIWASEKMDVEFMTNEGASDDTKSGIDSVSASYSQKGSSEETEVKDIDYDTSNGATTYSFSIDEDSEVSAESIKIDLRDKAGNENNNQGIHDTTTNIDVAKLVAEASAPTISTTWDSSDAQNGRYYNHNRSVTFTVNAPFFEYTQEYLGNHAMATITKDGSAWKTVTPGDFTKTGDDTWSCTISFTEDGDYEVSNVNATDVLGRTSTAAGDTFTIDKTTPTMQVSFDNNNVANGKYYNAARTATITITEHNFDPSLVHITPTAGAGNGGEVGQPSISGWSTSGDVHTATVTFPGQGVYTLSVDGMDLATNELTPYTCPEFVVDTLTPEITISGVENMTAYQGDVNPSVAVHDTNLDSATDIHVQVVGTSPYGEEANPFTNDPSITATDASVSYRNPSDVKANDNVYTVVVNAVDLAGNTSDDAVTFSVNRFGSTYVISDETGKMLNEYLKFDDTSDVRVTEINPSGLDASQTAVELTRDTSNTTLSADDYTVEQGSASGWQEYVYTVNRDNYDTDGVYRVLFHSQDRAGNVSENEMEGKNAADEGASAQINFAVDDTAPLASFVDLSNTEPYNESSHVAKVTFEDNLMLDHAVVEINGEEVATFDAEQLAQSATQEFTINESNGNQSVRVTVYDAAGNEGEAVMDNVVVTTNAFELWRRNTPLFAGTIAVAVLAAAGVIFVVAKKRSKDGEAEA